MDVVDGGNTLTDLFELLRGWIDDEAPPSRTTHQGKLIGSGPLAQAATFLHALGREWFG